MPTFTLQYLGWRYDSNQDNAVSVMPNLSLSTVIHSIEGCAKVNCHESSNLLILHSPEDVIDNLNQNSLTAIVRSIGTLIVWKQILVFTMLIKLLEYSTFHHSRQETEIADQSKII